MFSRADGVELSGADHNDIACLHIKGSKIQGDAPASLFNIDNFHLIMPVQRHLLKVKWNGANVSIVRKIGCAVRLRFMIIFIFWYLH